MRRGLHARVARGFELLARLFVFLLALLILLLFQLQLARAKLLVDEHARRRLVHLGEQTLGVVRDLQRLLPGLIRLENLFALVLVDGAPVRAQEQAGGLIQRLRALALQLDALPELLLKDRERLGVDAAGANHGGAAPSAEGRRARGREPAGGAAERGRAERDRQRRGGNHRVLLLRNE